MLSNIDDQLTIENTSFEDANLRLRRDNEKANSRQAWSESKLGIAFTTSASKAFGSAVSTFLNQPSTEGRRMNRAAEKLRQTRLEPEVIAHLFTKSLFNLLPLTHRRRVKRVSLCIKAADLIHDEWRIREFANQDNRRNLLKKLFKQFDKRTYPRDWRKRTILNYFYAEQVEWSQWTTHDKLHVGYALLILFRDSTSLVKADKASMYVDPTEELILAVEDAMKKRVLDYMIYPPMVVKPLPWTPKHLFRGGYLSTKLIRRYPIIKGSRKRDVERFMDMKWDNILPAINALQETSWRVNKTMLEVLEWAMFERGGGIAGLPLADAKPLPPEPEGYRTDETIRKDHDRVCFLIHSENREIISKRLQVLFTITVAKQFKNFKAIYFPHNLDSRGRAYPLPAFLNPQGPDFTKSLLEFAEGKPIENEEQAAWLAIAGANAYGEDKISLQERVNWVQDNDEMIFSIANDPKGDIRWMTEASEPFQFLRFCLEWSAFWKTGFGFISHMVVPVDATCSGLQHYSAMLRDDVGGRSVNLVPHLPRQDVYSDVADKVNNKLMEDGHNGNPLAKPLLQLGIDRKITKRQVMVVPYAGTFSSCMEYTREAITDKLQSGHISPWQHENESNQFVVYLARLIWDAIDETVIKGKEAMRWLSKAASEYTKWANKNLADHTAFDKRMSWVTPDGFEVIHYRASEKQKRIDTFLDGRVNLAYNEATSKLESRDMALAVAPNFVHSYDACLLRMSVIRGMNMGLTHFGMVHDSFGTHAHDMARFVQECVKPAFIEMYQENALANFEKRLPDEVRVSLDPLPEMGKLDLNGVLENEFFFS